MFTQTEDMFFDVDDMEKFADEGTMDDDDLEGESRVRDERFCWALPAVRQPGHSMLGIETLTPHLSTLFVRFRS